jgi:hypothetical protein
VPGKADAAVQTYTNTNKVLGRKTAPRDDLDRLEAKLDQQEMQAMAHGGLGVEAYIAHLDEVKSRVKRWDEQLGSVLDRAVVGLRRGLDSYSQPTTVYASQLEAVPTILHDTFTQTETVRNSSPERYPGLLAAQEALDRLRDVKYSGVASKLSELYRALSRLTSTDFPDPPSSLQDIAPLPDAFAQELRHTFRLIHKDIAQSVLLKHKKPLAVSIAMQTEGSGFDPLKVFELEQGIRERETELGRLRADFVDLRVGYQGSKEQVSQLKTLNLNLEEKVVRLDMEVKVWRSKEQTASTALVEVQQLQKATEEKQVQLQKTYMHLLSTLYSTSDKVRRAEHESLHLEEALAQAEVTHVIDQRKLTGGSTPAQLEEELRGQRNKIKGEYETKRAEMLRRHQLMQQQLQDQTFKVDALIESGSALLKPKPRVWAEEEGEPQSPIKSPKKPRVELEDDTPKAKAPKQEIQLPRPETQSEEEEPSSPVGFPASSPRPSPARKTTYPSEPRSPTRFPQPSSPSIQAKPSKDLQLQPVPAFASQSVPLSAPQSVLLSASQPVSLPVEISKQQETERSATEALAAMSAESISEERALLDQLSPNEQAVFYKAKALLEHQRVWEQAVRMGMCSKATQTGEHALPLPAIQSFEAEEAEMEGTPWLKHVVPSPQGLSPRSKRSYHQAVLKAFVGHSERCGAVCQHLLRAMQVRRKVRGLLFPLRVINVRYRLAK